MIPIIFYYLVLPFIVFAILLKIMRRYQSDGVPKEIRQLYTAHPVEKGSFRALRVEGRFGSGPVRLGELGDFESQEEAVDAAFAEKSKTGASPAGAAFLVLNDKGEILQEL